MRLAATKYGLLLPALFLCFISSSSAEEIQALPAESDTFQLILKTTKKYYSAWSYTRTDTVYDQASLYYSKDADRLGWDPLPPLKGHRGWGKYKNVIETVWKPNGLAAAGILFAHDGSFQAWRYQDVIWTTANCLVYAQYDTRDNATMPCRGTQIWIKEGGNWLVAHEHFSAPAEPGDGLFNAPEQRDPHADTTSVFSKLSKQLAAAWADGPVASAGSRLRKFYATDHDVRLYMPWAPHDGFQSWPEFEQGLADYVSLTTEKVSIAYHGDLETTQFGDIAWTTATVKIHFDRSDKPRVSASGRQTLIWTKQNNRWLIVHEHLSIPMGQ